MAKTLRKSLSEAEFIKIRSYKKAIDSENPLIKLDVLMKEADLNEKTTKLKEIYFSYLGLRPREFFSCNEEKALDIINQMLAEVLVQENATYKAYLENELAILDRKAANKKPTKTQQENENIKAELLAVLTDKGMTVTEIQSRSEMLGVLSNQRVSAILKQMVDAKQVVKDKDAKRSVFSLRNIFQKDF